MLTCKSPQRVILAAWRLAQVVVPEHTSRFRGGDFTLPQMFAYRIVREHQCQSYRGVEAPLRAAASAARSAAAHTASWRRSRRSTA